MYKVRVSDMFSAAHYLRNYKGKCENLHGHNWKVFVEVSGTELDRAGMLVDFGVLKKGLREILGELDHKNLNEEVLYFKTKNPSAENISRYVFDKMNGFLNGRPGKISSVSVHETENNVCTYSE